MCERSSAKISSEYSRCCNWLSSLIPGQCFLDILITCQVKILVNSLNLSLVYTPVCPAESGGLLIFQS